MWKRFPVLVRGIYHCFSMRVNWDRVAMMYINGWLFFDLRHLKHTVEHFVSHDSVPDYCSAMIPRILLLILKKLILSLQIQHDFLWLLLWKVAFVVFELWCFRHLPYLNFFLLYFLSWLRLGILRDFLFYDALSLLCGMLEVFVVFMLNKLWKQTGRTHIDQILVVNSVSF